LLVLYTAASRIALSDDATPPAPLDDGDELDRLVIRAEEPIVIPGTELE
jgi:hypothetical protein